MRSTNDASSACFTDSLSLCGQGERGLGALTMPGARAAQNGGFWHSIRGQSPIAKRENGFRGCSNRFVICLALRGRREPAHCPIGPRGSARREWASGATGRRRQLPKERISASSATIRVWGARKPQDGALRRMLSQWRRLSVAATCGAMVVRTRRPAWPPSQHRVASRALGRRAGQEVVRQGPELVDGGIDLAGEVAFDWAGPRR
jgi:hypothetical protein